ncbi:MAG TPA: hypothetical protein VHH36_08175 [Candidatus Thermoplasmatota archaeon]|nr:hypothetical protein [Candidatus Thermoplasmatota archaeon]
MAENTGARSDAGLLEALDELERALSALHAAFQEWEARGAASERLLRLAEERVEKARERLEAVERALSESR